MTRIILLLICGLVPSILAQCNEETAQPKLKRALYEFSINLLTRSAQEKENHFVISPLSIWTLLACTSLGAKDSTLNELKNVLRLNRHKCYNEKYLSIVNKVISDHTSDVIVKRSASIFVDDKFPVKDIFKSRVINSGLSSIESMSFESPESAIQEINKYVNQATDDMIDEVIAPGDFDPTSVMIMIDVVYFKGGWQIPFEYEKTISSEFYDERGDVIDDVNLMLTTGEFKCTYIERLQAEVLEVPYGKVEENRYSMFFFLPQETTTLYTVIDNLKKVNLASIKYLLSDYGEQTVTVQVPRFKISSDISNLKELLADMGLKAMFDSAQASFPIISNEQIFVSNFMQKAEIEVTEKGTVASAATKAVFSLRTSPKEFTLNRPFLFIIVDKNYDIPIFTGAYSKPTLY